MPIEPNHIPIYHITHVNNVSRILKEDGLWSDAQCLERGLMPANVAHLQLKERRMERQVPLPVGGTLGNYVPFYFCNRSPMLYSIHSGCVADCAGDQRDMVYLVSSVGQVLQYTQEWCFTDGHAVLETTKFYENIDACDKIDWPVIDSWSWKDTLGDNDRKRRKQAEFLVKNFFSWSLIERVGVHDMRQKEVVNQLLNAHAHCPILNIEPQWYY